MNALPALICGYLDGDDESLQVLNDALEELGRDRCAISGPEMTRLSVVLENILPEPLMERIMLDFAEHVSDACASDQARILLDAKRSWVTEKTGDRSPFPVGLLRSLHNLGWADDNSAKSNAVWTLWSVLIAQPKHVVAAAQRVRAAERSWQIEHVKKMVLAHL